MMTILLAAIAIQAAPVPAPNYTVSLAIAADGRTLGTPTIVLRDGQPGSIKVDGPDGYLAEVTVRGATSRGEAGADVEMRISRKQAGGWVVLSKPRMVVTLNKPASMRLGPDGGPPTVALGVTVTKATL